ncbi:telomere recombination domain protein [Bacteriovorax sp. BSW11_IV]|uniref:L-threonylcarbamoyladenylate synthase n=1 Tax=Bacteriovorax sp. BSW11_IV TaxID=1353529 RepID=UPI000389F287|nr:Sua5/YciO/YrdC/YwlC family protein [Bacteriovorax sp. BSW11_IV]EQC48383.1 telomere recombination domain protein [Bacteriovorax sp. BSW11_IV]
MIEKLFVYPTDTVWGIGGSIFVENNHKNIALVKGTSPDKPLSILFKNISHLREYFNLPEKLNDSWLREFFNMGTSLGVPVTFAKNPFPSWVNCGSEIVFVRVLNFPFVEKMINEAKAPIFTTSLNLTGQPPCIEFSDAKAFFDDHLKIESTFVDTKELVPSGESSTMVILDSDLSTNISRRGSRVLEVQKHIEKLNH